MDALPCETQFTSILPNEIAEYILRLACPPIEWGGHKNDHLPSHSAPLILSHVSRSWRSFVHAAPLLWTDICIHKRYINPEMLRKILHYSKDCPLTACVVFRDASDMQWIDSCIKELFCHAHRIRSFRLDLGFRKGLWSEDVPLPPFSMLEDLKILGGPNSEQDIARLYPLFDSPQLRNVSWLSDDQFPAPLLRVGAQIKQLTLSDCAIGYIDVVGLLKACPNVAHLDVCPGGPYRPILNCPIHLKDLHTLRTSELGIDSIIAPNLRHLTLTLSYGMVLTEDTDRLYRMTRLPQFLSLSPRIEYLHLELWDYQSLGIIYEIVPLTPCLITLEITSRQSYLHLDTVLGILTQDPPWKCTLPKLQHLKLDVLTIPKVGGPPLIDTEQLLQMLESRCMPNSIPDRLGDASRPAPAVLKSCDINQRRFRAEPLVNLNQKLWGAQCKQRLEVFRERGVALGGNVLASLLDGYPIGRAPPLALNKYSILSHLTDG